MIHAQRSFKAIPRQAVLKIDAAGVIDEHIEAGQSSDFSGKSADFNQRSEVCLNELQSGLRHLVRTRQAVRNDGRASTELR